MFCWRIATTLLTSLRAYGYVLSHWREIIAQRRKAQDLRRIPDRDLLEHSVSRLDYAQTGATGASRMARLVFDPLFAFACRNIGPYKMVEKLRIAHVTATFRPYQAETVMSATTMLVNWSGLVIG